MTCRLCFGAIRMNDDLHSQAQPDQPDSNAVAGGGPPHPLAVLLGRLAVAQKRWPMMGVWQRRMARKAIDAGAEYFNVDVDEEVRLAGLYIPPSPDAPTGRLPIVFAHGWIECKELHLAWGMKLAALGHPVMMYDHRGHGSSTGQHVTFGLREQDDVQSVVEFGLKRGWINDRIISVGYSLGSSAVLHHAVKHDCVAGIVAVAPFYDLPRAVESFRLRRMRLFSPAWVHGGFDGAAKLAGYSIDEVSSARAVEQLETPVMFIIPGSDRFVPAKSHGWPLTKLKTHGHCAICEVPQAGHISIVRRTWPELDTRLASYCKAISLDEPLD